MKNKKIGIALFAILIVSIIGFGIYYFVFQNKNSTTLTISEKKWIEENKNKMFSLSISTDIPVFSYNGTGIFFDFIKDTEKDLNLEFSKLPVSEAKEDTEYIFQVKSEVGENDILLYEDTYAIIERKEKNYHSIQDVNNLTLGVLESDLEQANLYLKGANVSVKTFESEAKLWEEFKKEESSLDGVVLPKLLCLEQELKNSYSINFLLDGFTKKYVFTLGSNETLNGILKKSYKKWENASFDETFGEYFSSEYFTFAKVEEKDKANFSSKQYQYGFVKNLPYDTLSNGKLVGVNSNILKSFSKVSNVEISFQEYSTIEELLQAFNERKVDFIYENNANKEYQVDVLTTKPYTGEELVVLTEAKNPIAVSNIQSLKGYEVLALKGTKIAEYLKQNGIEIQEYDSMTQLLKNKEKESILVLDSNTYEYYVRNDLQNYVSVYRMVFQEGNSFVVRKMNGNDVFAKFMDFYLSFVDKHVFISASYQDILTGKRTANILFLALMVLVASIVLLFVLFSLYKYIHAEKKQVQLTRGDRIRYIDQLTSLKNRNYLNDNIEKWDSSEVYPQSIVVVDLNNVAYINDNYGHQEGDTVIREAANILIRTQIENSEIMRTNGNEFLIYLVGYDEKQIVSYCKKLFKELKEVSHGFGAAVGYSIITDAIKTIDDAVNEATLNMREQKEELANQKLED